MKSMTRTLERSWGLAILSAGLVNCGPQGPTGEEITAADDIGEVEQDLELSHACSGKILNVVPTDRQPTLGGAIAIEGSGTCMGGIAPEFRFVATRGGTETVLCDWQPEGTCSLDATPLSTAGYYRLVQQTRRPGQVEVDSVTARRYAVGPVCTEVAVAAAPKPNGQVAVVVAGANCDPGTVPEFRFQALPPGGRWATFADYQTGGIATWDPNDSQPGRAYFRVQARRQGESQYDLMSRRVPYDFGTACTGTQLTVAGIGPSKSITGRAGCSAQATPEYRFSVEAPDGTVSLLRDWDYANTVDWDTSGINAGRYRAIAEVRAVEDPAQPVTRATRFANVAGGCRVTIDPLPTDLTLDDVVEITASTTCDAPEFEFLVRQETGGRWTTACDFAASPSCSWQPPAGALAGNYDVAVHVRHAGGSILQATNRVPVAIGTPMCSPTLPYNTEFLVDVDVTLESITGSSCSDSSTTTSETRRLKFGPTGDVLWVDGLLVEDFEHFSSTQDGNVVNLHYYSHQSWNYCPIIDWWYPADARGGVEWSLDISVDTSTHELSVRESCLDKLGHCLWYGDYMNGYARGTGAAQCG